MPSAYEPCLGTSRTPSGLAVPSPLGMRPHPNFLFCCPVSGHGPAQSGVVPETCRGSDLTCLALSELQSLQIHGDGWLRAACAVKALARAGCPGRPGRRLRALSRGGRELAKIVQYLERPQVAVTIQEGDMSIFQEVPLGQMCSLVTCTVHDAGPRWELGLSVPTGRPGPTRPLGIGSSQCY